MNNGGDVNTLRFSLAHSVYILVQTDKTPSNEEWNAHMADMEKRANHISCEIVYSAGGSPTPRHRRQYKEIWERLKRQNPPCAVVSPSSAGPIVVGLINLILPSGIRFFRDTQFSEALEHLRVPPILHESVCAHVLRHCEALEIKPPF